MIAAIELDPALYVQGQFIDDLPLADLQLQEDPEGQRTSDRLPLAGYSPADNDRPVWRGWQERDGSFHDLDPVMVRRGYGSELPLSELLSNRPPSVYYSDGRTIIGPTLYAPTGVRRELPDIPTQVLDWSNVDITKETETDAPDASKPASVGDAFKQWLLTRPRKLRHRWILNNDGPGEIADYIVLEVSPKPVEVSLSLRLAPTASASPPPATTAHCGCGLLTPTPRCCAPKLTTNMSHQQWREWVSPDIDYIKVGPDLPIPPDAALRFIESHCGKWGCSSMSHDLLSATTGLSPPTQLVVFCA